MCYKDFVHHWHFVEVCHLSADSFSDSLAESNQV